MKDWFDKLTSGVAYLVSLAGMTFSKLTFEQWYFILSLVIGLAALGLNYWHKRAMQRIANEKGVALSETD
ncbi:phage holin family protein [Vibrio alginolyticus]|uniref:phage holin family protein n=1 Tax=Vibrio alginolyticus TaxID=663 RepID=UPI0021D14FD2